MSINNGEWNQCVCVHFILFHFIFYVFDFITSYIHGFFLRNLFLLHQTYFFSHLIDLCSTISGYNCDWWPLAIWHRQFIAYFFPFLLYLHIASTTHFNYTLNVNVFFFRHAIQCIRCSVICWCIFFSFHFWLYGLLVCNCL